MPVINRQLNGKLNLDVSNYALPAGDYIDALNITRDSEGTGQDKIVANIKGNTLVTYDLPAGVNKCIGSFADLVRFRLYYYVWNSNGNHLWVYYDGATNTITKIIEDLVDTGSVAVLNFNPSKRINHIDIIYRDDDGDIVLWTDGNTTPKCANVSRILAAEYGVLKSAFIETAKKPPLSPITAIYGNDPTRNANSIKKNLFQFTYRYAYDDFQKSTFATYSKIPLPIGFYGSDNDINPTKNNFITLTFQSGDKDVAKLELAMRYNINGIWSDFVQIAVLDKSQLGISDNTMGSFVFYNDGVFPPIDINDLLRLFDYVPPLADTQALADGVYPVYGAITEGYPQFPQNLLDVDLSVANVTNNPPDVSPPTITYTSPSSGLFTFTVAGGVPVGTVYQIYLDVPPNPGPISGSHQLVATYTSVGGDTIATVATALYGSVNAFYRTTLAAPSFTVTFPAMSVVSEIRVTAGSGGAGISTEKTWLWNCNYIFGLVYVDEQNRDMPGVTTFYTSSDTTKDFSVTTPNFSLSGASVQTPVITANINHLPPAGAVKYYWVRRRLTVGNFVQYVTCDFQSDTNYYYFCLANIDRFKLRNSQFNIATAPITQNSRIMIMGGEASGGYDGKIWTQDYQILGTVVKTITGGTPGTDDFPFIKVQIPTSLPSPAYEVQMFVMVYEPASNPITAEDCVYNEFGEAYDIYTLDGVNYHRGKNQDQTSLLPASSVWPEGDVYFHKRALFEHITAAGETAQVLLNMMDANFSDYFLSAVNDNGRAQVIEPDARRQYDPVLLRHGGAFESGTNINEINRFDFLNFIEGNRSKGALRKLFDNKKVLELYQQFDVGVMPVFTQIIKDTAGNPLQADSDNLFNTIQYPYEGKFGIGDIPESFAFGKTARYFIDSNKGVVCRLSQDGITDLSVLYNTNAFFIPRLANYGKGLDNGLPAEGDLPYTGNPTVYGAFDAYTNKYIIALEQINRYTTPVVVISFILTVSLSQQIYFFGTLTAGVVLKLNLSATNGDAYSIYYTIAPGETSVSLRDNLITLVNASVLFNAGTASVTTPHAGITGVPSGTTLFGLSVSDTAGFATTAAFVIVNQLSLHQDAFTLNFNETRDTMEGFESPLSYHPENMICLNNLLITFLNGQFWRHDSTVFCNFYGQQFSAYITLVFNDQILIKKTFDRIAYRGNQIWVSDTNGDILTSDVDSQTGLPQISKLRSFDYEIDEGIRYASFLRDINSNANELEGLYEGNFLKGSFISCKLQYAGNDYAFLYIPHCGFSVSPKNS